MFLELFRFDSINTKNVWTIKQNNTSTEGSEKMCSGINRKNVFQDFLQTFTKIIYSSVGKARQAERLTKRENLRRTTSVTPGK